MKRTEREDTEVSLSEACHGGLVATTVKQRVGTDRETRAPQLTK